MKVTPINLDEANAFVATHHRHHKPVVGHKFAIAVSEDEVKGVAIVGRPVSRHMDDGWTLEVNRLCTDGTRNACSMLYAASWKAAKALGYRRSDNLYATGRGWCIIARSWMDIGWRAWRRKLELQN